MCFFTQNGKQKLPSRFLTEIGTGNYKRIGVIPKELDLQLQRSIHGDTAESSENKESYLSIGDKVTHPAFGRGEIVGYGKSKATYRIKFEKLENTRDISADFFRRRNSVFPVLDLSKEVSDKQLKSEINADSQS